MQHAFIFCLVLKTCCKHKTAEWTSCTGLNISFNFPSKTFHPSPHLLHSISSHTHTCPTLTRVGTANHLFARCEMCNDSEVLYKSSWSAWWQPGVHGPSLGWTAFLLFPTWLRSVDTTLLSGGSDPWPPVCLNLNSGDQPFLSLLLQFAYSFQFLLSLSLLPPTPLCIFKILIPVFELAMISR